MEKTRSLFKKIGDIKGTFHARMGTTKDRNSKDLTEAEEIKKRWQEYTEELSRECMFLGSVSSQQRFGVTDIKVPWVCHSSRVLDRPCYSSQVSNGLCYSS